MMLRDIDRDPNNNYWRLCLQQHDYEWEILQDVLSEFFSWYILH